MSTEIPTLDGILSETLEQMKSSRIQFDKDVEERQAQFRAATQEILTPKNQREMSTELKETIALIQSVPKIAPAVLKYTKELLGRIQAAVDAEINRQQPQ